MKTRNFIITIAAAALITVPLTVVAQGGPNGGSGGGAWRHGPGGGGFSGGPGNGLGFFDHMLPRLADSLDLTDQQLDEIQTIVDEARPLIDSYIEQLQTSREAYREAHPDPAVFDEGAFRAHATEQARIQVELMAVVQSTKAKAFAVLTPEQLAQLEEMRGAFGKRSMRRSCKRSSN
jgi:Spy/CpxP family protein refolding chaperone